MYSSDYGTAQIIEEREYLRKHASHIQVPWNSILTYETPGIRRFLISLILGLGRILASEHPIIGFPLSFVLQVKSKVRKSEKSLNLPKWHVFILKNEIESKNSNCSFKNLTRDKKFDLFHYCKNCRLFSKVSSEIFGKNRNQKYRNF